MLRLGVRLPLPEDLLTHLVIVRDRSDDERADMCVTNDPLCAYGRKGAKTTFRCFKTRVSLFVSQTVTRNSDTIVR